MSTTSFSQRDARASTLLEQSGKLKSELGQSIKTAFAPQSNRARHAAHPRDSSVKLLNSDTDFARKNLRNTYLNLLFTCTFTREAQSVDGLLWTDTCYNLITSYRSYLASALKASDTAEIRRGRGAHEFNRVKNEFRQFLIGEEAFWHDLVGRVVRLFSLDEARSSLEALGIMSETDAESTPSASTLTDSFSSRAVRQTNEPDEALSQAALLPTKRAHLIAFLHSFLIFSGDLARYREIASRDDDEVARGSRDAGAPKYDFSRAVAFYEQAKIILPDKGNSSNQLAVVANYNHNVFSALYHYYRALCCKTPFSKAKINVEKLLLKPTAAYLDRRLSAPHAPWDKPLDDEARDPTIVEHLSDNTAAAERVILAWTEQVVVLHGLFFKRSQLDEIQYLSKSVLATFATLVRARALRADQIVRFVVAALCASWTTRLWRTASSSSSKTSSTDSDLRHRPRAVRSEKARKSTSSPETVQCVEYLVLAHVLGIFQELIQIDASETRNALNVSNDSNDGDNSPVRHLTPVVRRTLPAMRIMNKWIKTHLEYMQRSEKRAIDAVQRTTSLEAHPVADLDEEHAAAYATTLSSITNYWTAYVDLINNLRFAFPFDSLPNIGKVGSVGASALCLEEDTDMRGFAPTRKATQSTIPGGTTITFGMGEACANVESVKPDQLHPNEEQLMRIADILIDAKVVAESDASPLLYDDKQNSFRYVAHSARIKHRNVAVINKVGAVDTRSTVQPGPQQARLAQTFATNASPDDIDTDDDSATTEDPVDLAMRAVDSRESDDFDAVESFKSLSMTEERSTSSQGADPLRQFVPSQVRLRRNERPEDLARELFASYPVASLDASDMSRPAEFSSSSEGFAPLMGSRSNSSGAQQPDIMLANASAMSSIWEPSTGDARVTAAHPHATSAYTAPQSQYQSQAPLNYGAMPNVWGNHSAQYPYARPPTQPPQQSYAAPPQSNYYAPYANEAQAYALYQRHIYDSLHGSGVSPSVSRPGSMPAANADARSSPFSDPYYPGHPASPYQRPYK